MPRGWERRGETIRAYVTIDGVRTCRTFHGTTPPEDIAVWRAQERKRRRWLARAELPPAGTLDEDVALYLETFTGRHPETQRQRRRHLDAWCAAFRGRRRDRLTPREIEAVLASWRAQRGYSGATLNKLRQALFQLYAVLDRGAGVPNPVAAVPTFPVAEPLPRGVSLDTVAKLLARVPWPATRARLTLMAYCGLRPTEIRRIQPGDWDQTSLLVRTAKGGDMARVPLPQPALLALELLKRRGKLGAFTGAPLARAMVLACRALSKTLKLKTPLHVTPYDLRHSYGTAPWRARGSRHWNSCRVALA